jgi:hypothetical protein
MELEFYRETKIFTECGRLAELTYLPILWNHAMRT